MIETESLRKQRGAPSPWKSPFKPRIIKLAMRKVALSKKSGKVHKWSIIIAVILVAA